MSSSEPIRTRPVRKAPPQIRRFSSAVLADLAGRTKFVDPALAASWGEIAGAEIAALCRPGRLTGGKTGRTLEVVAPNGAAASKVQFEAEGLRRRLNDFLGPNVVGRIAIRQAGAAPSLQPEGDGPSPLGAALGRFRASFTKARGEPQEGDR